MSLCPGTRILNRKSFIHQSQPFHCLEGVTHGAVACETKPCYNSTFHCWRFLGGFGPCCKDLRAGEIGADVVCQHCGGADVIANRIIVLVAEGLISSYAVSPADTESWIIHPLGFPKFTGIAGLEKQWGGQPKDLQHLTAFGEYTGKIPSQFQSGDFFNFVCLQEWPQLPHESLQHTRKHHWTPSTSPPIQSGLLKPL